MVSWISEHRADIALVIILGLMGSLLWSIWYGVRESRRVANEQVFGDPERTLGGWYWALCGVSALLLVWFYFSWGMARSFVPTGANELCQVAKIEEALSPITARLPIGARYYKSTTLVVRNDQQLNLLKQNIPVNAYLPAEQQALQLTIDQIRNLLAIYSNTSKQSLQSSSDLNDIAGRIERVTQTISAGYSGLSPSKDALAQPKWGVSDIEIPLLPITSRGKLFDNAANEIKLITADFLKLRNIPPEAEKMIVKIRAEIAEMKAENKNYQGDAATKKSRDKYLKAVERIFKRLDDGTIFPANALVPINDRVLELSDTIDQTKGGLQIVDALFFPGHGVVKSKTLCIEQGSSRWLPKPTDVVATFSRLANPNFESGGGFKGTTLLWWKWLQISDIVDFFIPDGLIDMLPGTYGHHNENAAFEKTYKDKLLHFAQGDVYLGEVPMLDGHIWDSLFRVLVAMALGVLLGVPLGIYMGVSKFFKSFFDPLIELYRPVPPLAWAPLILTIFGIQDDGKIFLLFMVAFAIMVISARTGASGTQLSKIRASHSLGASNKQIVRYVILPNALPEILTGIRIAIGVCWGTLVAAEMLAGTTGIGFIENVARTVSDYELIWVTILIMGLLGLLFDLVMRQVIKILIPWRGKG